MLCLMMCSDKKPIHSLSMATILEYYLLPGAILFVCSNSQQGFFSDGLSYNPILFTS